MNLYGALSILWCFSIIMTITATIIIDSDDCTIYNNGWDRICNDAKEERKAWLYQLIPTASIVLSVIMIIVIGTPTKENQKKIEDFKP